MKSSTSDVPEKEGYIRKRGGRMMRWTQRYFTLSASKLSYKLRSDSTVTRGEYDLDPGCKVTDIVEEFVGTLKGRRIFVFWLVWPHDKHLKAMDERGSAAPEDSDDDDERSGDRSSQKSRYLKDIVEAEQNQHKEQQKRVDEQIERHQAHDKVVSTGTKLAAVALGGVVVGVFTGNPHSSF